MTLEELGEAEIETLVKILRSKFSAKHLDFENAISEALAVAYASNDVRDLRAFVLRVARLNCINELRKAEVDRKRREMLAPDLDDSEASADDSTLGVERRSRQSAAFYRMVKQYAEECQATDNLDEKEVFERQLNGENKREIVAAFATEDQKLDSVRRQVDRHIQRSCERMARLRSNEDPELSIFLSMFGEQENVRRDRFDTESLLTVLMNVLNETDALCPSSDRLLSFWDNQDDPSFRDVHYHVAVRQCPICAAAKGNCSAVE